MEVTGVKCTCRHIIPTPSPVRGGVIQLQITFCCSGILIRAWLCHAPQCITLQTALTLDSLSSQCYLHYTLTYLFSIWNVPQFLSDIFQLSTFIFSPVISQEANYFCEKFITLFILNQSGSLVSLSWFFIDLLFLIFIAHWKYVDLKPLQRFKDSLFLYNNISWRSFLLVVVTFSIFKC